VCSTIVALMVVRLKFSNNRTPVHEHVHDHVNVHVDVHVVVDVFGFFVTIGYILPASGPSFACSERLSESEEQTLFVISLCLRVFAV
jgi:hypothetical protein